MADTGTDFQGLPPAGLLEDADVFALQRGTGEDSTKGTTLGDIKTAVGEGAAKPVRIAVLGDSLSTQNYVMAPAWPTILEGFLRQCGENVQVFNCSAAAHTFNRANTVVNFGTRTAVQQAIALSPDIVMVALGYNDTMAAVDARTLAQVQGDADAVMASLRADLPDATIVYLSERPYDSINFPNPGTAAMKNKGTMGVHFQKRTTGPLAGQWSLEIQDDVVSPTVYGRLADWVALDSHIQTNTAVNMTEVMDLWRIHRMGGALRDMLHINAAGVILQAGYAIRALESLIPDLLQNNNAVRNDPDGLFTAMFTASGDGWDYTPNAQAMAVMHSLEHLVPWSWCVPTGGTEMFISLTQVEYDALSYKDPSVLYLVVG